MRSPLHFDRKQPEFASKYTNISSLGLKCTTAQLIRFKIKLSKAGRAWGYWWVVGLNSSSTCTRG